MKGLELKKLLCLVGVLWAVLSPGLALGGPIHIDSAYPGGNVKVLSVDDAAGVVRLEPDLRDTKGHWFHFDFAVRGAAGRTLKFRFPQDGKPYLSTLGPAISKNGIQWTWLNADGKRHEPDNAFDYTFGMALRRASAFLTAFSSELGRSSLRLARRSALNSNARTGRMARLSSRSCNS